MSDPEDIDVKAWQAEIEAILEQIRPLLAGLGSVLQGAVLAELVSMWLAGHLIEEQRRQVEASFRDHYQNLVPINIMRREARSRRK